MRAARAASTRRPAVQIPVGGLLVVGGPPLEGKGVLAARLTESLPFAIKIETVDHLSHGDELWFRDGPTEPGIADPLRQMLALARSIWEERQPAEPPVIVLAARFATPAARSRAATMASNVGMKFLFVEVRSSQIRALRRIPVAGLASEQAVARIELYERILSRYKPLGDEETRLFRSVRLKRALGNLEGALQRVLRVWRTG